MDRYEPVGQTASGSFQPRQPTGTPSRPGLRWRRCLSASLLLTRRRRRHPLPLVRQSWTQRQTRGQAVAWCPDLLRHPMCPGGRLRGGPWTHSYAATRATAASASGTDVTVTEDKIPWVANLRSTSGEGHPNVNDTTSGRRSSIKSTLACQWSSSHCGRPRVVLRRAASGSIERRVGVEDRGVRLVRLDDNMVDTHRTRGGGPRGGYLSGDRLWAFIARGQEAKPPSLRNRCGQGRGRRPSRHECADDGQG